jgi:hypothetical protein
MAVMCLNANPSAADCERCIALDSDQAIIVRSVQHITHAVLRAHIDVVFKVHFTTVAFKICADKVDRLNSPPRATRLWCVAGGRHHQIVHHLIAA